MLKEERYDKILEILEGEKYISAHELSRRLFVSLPTIRRDLAELSRRNLIVRSHGGAKKVGADHAVMPLDFRKTISNTEKRRLCRAAAELVSDNDIIFIDASTTALQMAEFLSGKKSLTVITNGIPLASYLVQKGIKTCCVGGELSQSSLAFSGSLAEEFIQNFNIDAAFFSSYGINEIGMIVDASLSETQLRKVAIRQAKRSVFLCDSTKFMLSAPYNLMPLCNADYIITNADVDAGLFPEIHRAKIIKPSD